MPGIPGMVPPMIPPEASSIRARYQIAGAVSSRWGSLASSAPPAAERAGAAAQAFDAPERPAGRTGASGFGAAFGAKLGRAPGTSSP